MTNRRANILLLLAALFWGLSNVPQKTVLQDIGPFTAVGLRCLIGAAVILPLIWRDLVGVTHIKRSDCLKYLEVALLFTAAVLLQQFAYVSTTVTNASFLISTTTVMTPLAAWWLLRERVSGPILIAVAAALSGAFIMSGGAVEPFSTGDFLCLASAGLYSIWFVRLGALVVRTGRAGLVIITQFMTAALVSLVLAAATEHTTLQSLNAALVDVVLLGVIGTGLPYGLQAIAQQRVTAPAAAILTSAESVFGALAAAVFLGERFTGSMGAGAVLVMIAIIAVPAAQAVARVNAQGKAASPGSRHQQAPVRHPGRPSIPRY